MNLQYTEYINLHDWILDHMSELHLESSEVLVLLQMDHFLRKNRHIEPSIIAKLCQFSLKEFDEAITRLIQKGYIKISIHEKNVEYQIINLFEKENTKLVSSNMPIIDLFEREFKRPLTAHEIDKLNDWIMKVDHAYLIHALREALIYQKLNFNYIDRILVKWIDNKVSLQDLDAGKK